MPRGTITAYGCDLSGIEPVETMTRLTLTQQLVDELSKLGKGNGMYQTAFKRVHDSVRTIGSKPPFATVSARDLHNLRDWAKRAEAGPWRIWARAALAYNDGG